MPGRPRQSLDQSGDCCPLSPTSTWRARGVNNSNVVSCQPLMKKFFTLRAVHAVILSRRKSARFAKDKLSRDIIGRPFWTRAAARLVGASAHPVSAAWRRSRRAANRRRARDASERGTTRDGNQATRTARPRRGHLLPAPRAAGHMPTWAVPEGLLPRFTSATMPTAGAGGRFRWLLSTCLAGAVGVLAILVVIAGSMDTQEGARRLHRRHRRPPPQRSARAPAACRQDRWSALGRAQDRQAGDPQRCGGDKILIPDGIRQRRGNREYILNKYYVRLVARLAPVPKIGPRASRRSTRSSCTPTRRRSRRMIARMPRKRPTCSFWN